RCGFGQADSIPVFLESLKLLHLHGPLDGYRLSSMSCSGGEASIMADAAHGRRVYFPDLDQAQKNALQNVLGPRVAIANPLDYQTYCWGDRAVMQAAYSTMAGFGFDLNLLVLDFPHPARCNDSEWHIAVDGFEAALDETRSKGAFVVGMAENITEEYSEDFRARGMVAFYGIEEAIRACEIAADIGTAWQREADAPLLPITQLGGPGVALDEAAAKRCLAKHGVPVPVGGRVDSVEAAREMAHDIGYPVVLKALGIAHKTEHDAVWLNLQSDVMLADAARALFELSDELYLEEMKPAQAEMIVGVTRDPTFGLTLTVGSGGILVEVLQDSVTLLVPATRQEIEEALNSLRSAPLMRGYRGRQPADIAAAADAVEAIQRFAIANAGSLLELDVNPLLIGAQGEGVFAADALIVLQEQKNV
ncbi:MAG: acetate--CoA ligase family protein, partial [Gammaproteobacteria bacterium]